MSGTQTLAAAIWFPIKVLMPEIQFDVVFPNETEYQNFQKFVRVHQQQAQARAQILTLNWPQRNITNWTGFIRHFEAGGQRFNIRPSGSFIVDLVDSFASNRTYQGSIAANWNAIYDLGVPGSVLAPAIGQELQYLTSPGTFGAPAATQAQPAPPSVPAPAPTGPTAAMLPGSSGILPGSSVGR
jgi:hypothetical protein